MGTTAGFPHAVELADIFGPRLGGDLEFNIFQRIAVGIQDFDVPFSDFMSLNDLGAVGSPGRRIDTQGYACPFDISKVPDVSDPGRALDVGDFAIKIQPADSS